MIKIRQITREEWDRKPPDYRGRYGPVCGVPELMGERNWLTMDPETGATVLEPVEIIED